MNNLDIYTDGGSKGNPGPSSIGVVIYKDKKEYFFFHKDIGIKTNNEAEYTAVIEALLYIKSNINIFLNIDIINLFSDSKLMVNQLNGLFKVKNPNMREFIMKIRILEQEIKIPIKYINIPREKNKRADMLVNQ